MDAALKDVTVDEDLLRIGLDIFHVGSIFVTAGDTNVMAVESWIPEWKKTLKSGSTSNLNIVSPDFYDHPNMNLVDMLIELSGRIRPSWPSAFRANIAAAPYRPTIGKEYFFKADEYLRYAPRQGVDHVLTVAKGWTDWPDRFEQGIDAALARPSSNKEYFFKGDEYIRYT